MRRALALVLVVLFGCLPGPDGRVDMRGEREDESAVHVVTGAEIDSPATVEPEGDYYPQACPTAEPSSGFTVYRFPRRISIPTPED